MTRWALHLHQLCNFDAGLADALYHTNASALKETTATVVACKLQLSVQSGACAIMWTLLHGRAPDTGVVIDADPRVQVF